MVLSSTHKVVADLPRPAGPPATPARPVPVGLSDQFNAAAMLKRIQDSVGFTFREGAHELTFRALGTQCRISIVAPPALATFFRTAALNWIANFEAKYSRFWTESLVSRINRNAGGEWTALDAEADRIFALCNELHFLTRGILDPTALPLIELWNWKEPRTTIPTPAEIDAARSRVGWRKVQRAPGKIRLPDAGMRLDLGGIGKEYAVDQITQLAINSGVTSALVDFGADLRVFGLPPDGRPAWHIGLEDPSKPGTCWTGLAVRDSAVATSGDYLRRFELNGIRYGHILDVRTGCPVANGIRSVSVMAPSCTQAGMLSTSIFVLGAEGGAKLLDSTMGVTGAIITDTGTVTGRTFFNHATP